MTDLLAPSQGPSGPAGHSAGHSAGHPAGHRGPAPRRLGAHLRAALVAGLSALVLMGSLVYVFAPAQASVRMSVTEVTGTPAYEQDILADYELVSDAVAARRPWRETIYGSIETRGVPVSHAVLRIKGVTEQTRRQAVRIQIGGAGTYRSAVRLRPGKYRLTLSLDVGSSPKSVSVERRLKHKRSYQVSVLVQESGIVTLLPVTSY
jgi:hypothetical protein